MMQRRRRAAYCTRDIIRGFQKLPSGLPHDAEEHGGLDSFGATFTNYGWNDEDVQGHAGSAGVSPRLRDGARAY